MPGPKKRARAVGPYPHGNSFRAVAIGATGDREYHTFNSEAEARDFIREFNTRVSSLTVGEAVTEFLEWLKVHGNNERGMRERSLVTAEYRLRGILRPELLAALTDVTPGLAKRLYAKRAAAVSADTHRGELSLAQAWGAWCVTERGYFGSNPFADVKATGARNARSGKLRTDDARRFVEAALSEETPEGLAAALALLTGMRASEVADRLVRDIDDNGRVMCIPVSKTNAGQRELEIPSVLRNRFAALVKGKAATDRIFPELTRHGLYYHVRRLCRDAGVPEVSPHDLRRSFASLSSRSGTATEQVARTLGHASMDVTRRHYLDAGAEQSAAAARAEETLFNSDNGGRSVVVEHPIVVETVDEEAWFRDWN
jgi:integrase